MKRSVVRILHTDKGTKLVRFSIQKFNKKEFNKMDSTFSKDTESFIDDCMRDLKLFRKNIRKVIKSKS